MVLSNAARKSLPVEDDTSSETWKIIGGHESRREKVILKKEEKDKPPSKWFMTSGT